MKSRIVPKIGDKYNMLTVVKFSHKDRNSYYQFKCECGNKKVIKGTAVVTGNIKSCGCIKGSKLPNNEGIINNLFSRYKRGAKYGNRAFELTKEQFDILIHERCHYCGSPPSNNRHGFIYSGIDRVDNSIGYIKSNVVSCCKSCNFLKGSVSAEEFLLNIERISKYQKKLRRLSK